MESVKVKKHFFDGKIKYINAIVLTLVFASSTFLFNKQITVSEEGQKYYADLFAHFKSAIEGDNYSLTHKIFWVLWNCTKSKLSISIFLGIVVTLTVITLAVFIKKICEYSYDKKIKIKFFIVPAALCLFIASIYIPVLSPAHAEFRTIYHLICAQVWHNSTYLAMRLVAPLVLVYYYSFYKDNKVRVRDWLIFVVLLTITNASKPSFFIAFAPAVLIVLIIDFIKEKGKNILFSLQIGTAVLCSIPILIYQSQQLFGDTDGGAEISLKEVFKGLINYHSLFWVLANLLVPFLVLILSIKLREINRIYIFSWLMFVIGWAESIFIIETGERASHGNFSWQNPLVSLFLYIVSVINLVSMYKKKKINKQWFIIICGILSLNIISGLVYYIKLLFGAAYLN